MSVTGFAPESGQPPSRASASSNARPKSPHEGLLYAALVLLLLLPIWANRYFLTQDGPMHLHNARILLDHLTASRAAAYRDYYYPSISLFPYWFGHLSLSLLLAMFPPSVAEKLFWSGYIVLFALLLRLLIRAVNREAVSLAFLGLPLVCQRAFEMGFFDFCFSIVFALLILWYWIRHGDEMSHGAVLTLSGLFLVLYFCHPTTYFFTVLAVTCLFLCGILSQGPGALRHAPAGVRAGLEQSPGLIVAILPSALLFVSFLMGAPSYSAASQTAYGTLLKNFLAQSNLAVLGRPEGAIVLAVPVLFLVLAVGTIGERLRLRRLEREDGFLVAAFVALGLQLYGSRHFIGFFERMQFLPLLMLLPWLATSRTTTFRRRLVIAVSCLVVVGLVVVRFPRQARASAYVEEYVSVLPLIEDRSTVLALDFDQFGRAGGGRVTSDYIQLFLHAAEYMGASDKSLILLNNIGGLYPMFPYRWRPERNPFTYLQTNEGIENEPPSADFASYLAKTGGSVDYVVTWGLEGSPYLTHPYTLRILDQLKQGYAPVFTSANHRAVLYKARAPVKELPITGPERRDGNLSAGDYIGESLRLYRAQRYVECIQAAEKALALEPNSYRAYNNICAAYNSLGHWDEAIAAGERAVALDPTSDLARNNLAWARSRKAQR